MSSSTSSSSLSSSSMSSSSSSNHQARFRALFYMTLANAFHFGSYEFARSAIAALFTTTTTMSSSSWSSILTTMPFALGMVSPCSIILLYCYKKYLFDRIGPQLSLRYITLIYAICLFTSACIILYFHCNESNNESTTNDHCLISSSNSTSPTTGDTLNCSHTTTTISSYCYYYYDSISTCTIILIFVLKNSFVQLLYSQHWSFISSILMSSSPTTTTTSSIIQQQEQEQRYRKMDYTTIIAGIGSIIATISSWLVGPILQLIQYCVKNNNYFHSTAAAYFTGNSTDSNDNVTGLTGLLLCSSIVMTLTAYCSDRAYYIAHMNGFAPKGRSPIVKPHHEQSLSQQNQSSSIYQRTKELLRRVPIIHMLCYEVLLCQSVSSLTSYLFFSYMKRSIPNDTHRATYTGTIYGRINCCTGLLQFIVLPILLQPQQRQYSHYDPSQQSSIEQKNTHQKPQPIATLERTGTDWYWVLLPSILGITGIVMIHSSSVNSNGHQLLLHIIMISFCTMKVLEYSLRVALVGQIYGPLQDEDRFLGKEIVSMIANRFGKSSSAVLIAVLSVSTRFPFLQYAPYILVCLCIVWLYVSVRLIQMSHSTILKKKVD